ncbi:MAG: tRNA epoxyqueuosine(34) reductase QueG [Dehalococcoidia bacterium]
MNPSTATATAAADLRAFARDLGFVAVGIARAEPLPDDRRLMQERIAAGVFEGLPWFTVERAARATDPQRSLPGARSIISLAAPYRGTIAMDAADLGPTPRGRIARYAWGRDYHRVLEKKLRAVCRWLDERLPGTRSRPMVDHGPLAERAYAARAGIGWTGKSTNLLAPGVGSWTLLGEALTTAILEPDPPLRKSCGACARCIAGCPTGAIDAPYSLDNRRCLSFQTIEQRGAIPRELRPLLGDWLFGCDICQDVCPVPAAHTAQPMPEFGVADVEAAAPALLPLLDLDEERFRLRFAGRAVLRAKRDGLLRNACVVLGNIAGDEAIPALAGALRDPAALVRGHAAWALGRIGGRAARAALTAARAREDDPATAAEIDHALDDPGRGGGAYHPAALAAWLTGRRVGSPAVGG